MRKLVTILSVLFCIWKTNAQSNISFQQLTTTHGLSYIGVRHMCVDEKGNLWIATGNGLNMFNGKTIERYLPAEYPQLVTNEVLQVTCDSSNRIWVLTSGGNVTMIDEKRQFHRVGLYNNNEFVKTVWMLNSKKHGIILYAGFGNYILKANNSFSEHDSITQRHFSFLPIKGFKEQKLKGRNQVFHYDDDNYLLVHQEAFLRLSYTTNTVDRKFSFSDCKALIKWGKDELLVYDRVLKEMKIINLVTEEVTYPFRELKDQFGKTITGDFVVAEKINDFQYMFGTEGSGIYIYNAQTKKIYRHAHNSADPTSIASNFNRAIVVGKKGWVFVTSVPNGISYFNYTNIVNSQYVFTDRNGKSYDGYIQGIATKDNNTFYLGTETGMLEWNRNSNTTNFIEFTDEDGKSIFRGQYVASLVIDKYDRVWAATISNGIVVMDKNRKLLKHIRNDTTNKHSLKIPRVSRLSNGPDGYVWVCGLNGISRINPENFAIDNFENTPLQIFDKMRVTPLFFADKDNLWISASFDGLYHYNLSTKTLKEIEAFKPYKKSGILDINGDSSGNIYVANRSSTGVKILFKNGGVKTIAQKDGLIMDWTEGLLLDKHNRMWIGNDIALACYNPADSSVKAFDVRYGLSIYGFRVGSYYKAPNGEYVLGTPRGLQYFHPDSLYNKRIPLNALITKIETKNVATNIDGSETFYLAANDNQATFSFGTIDYSQHLSTFYEYKLVDLDKDWIRIADQNSVRYNSLPPGEYVFKVRISNDNKTWQEAGNEVTIIIASPFYQTWWFKTLGILLGLSLIWYVIKYYEKKQLKQREELETELVINYFASQINRHQKTEDILWDVAKNCISKLNFEDCVIYLLDEERNMLVQKAAWGPKMAKDFTIYQPIEIPVGKGIVGSVAQTGKPELIANTEHDKRYIADDVKRFSELAVPLIIDNKLIGVIDSEHTRKNFFTKRHLNILSTVAVLCATQIKRATAEQEELEAQLVIDYFASQIHSRLKTDDLLWDVAKNLIGKMGFEDCMIYLWNDDKTVLVQKAGYGSKGSMEAKMDKTAYHIPGGKGIVGAAVETKKSQLVNDTSKDKRYFTADEKIMLSELCVPLVHDNEVLGAINTEHHQKNFFTTKHQKMLSTIAMLCANQLQRIRAEEEKQQARIEALQNKQKATETRLQSLRLQMNPHFLFNALNSVQQMILANEEMVATRYLSRFSKLLRMILVHSDKEMVMLKEEIEILKLYVELESIRFKDSFTYEINCDENIDTEEVRIPTLLIQPFVENAIWHGLMHKEGLRNLKIEFTEQDEFIKCTVEDNGIGRIRAKELKIKTGQDKKHKSKGIEVSEERLKAMHSNGVQGAIIINDLVDANGDPSGTQVEIIFPTKTS